MKMQTPLLSMQRPARQDNSLSLRLLSLAGLVVLSATTLFADDSPVLKKAGKELAVAVVVRDKSGKYAADITQNDLTLNEDGKPQSILSFSKANTQPLTVGLIIDTSSGQRNNIDQIRATSKHFLEQLLTGPKDRAFVLHFDREVELLQDTTAHRDKVLASLDQLTAEAPSTAKEESRGGRDSDSDTNDRRSRLHGPSDVFYDSVYLAANELMKKEQGRKILVVVADGGDRNSKVSAVSAIDAALQASAPLFAVYIKGEETHLGGNNMPSDRSSRRSGGSTWPGGGGGWPGGQGGGYPGGGSGGGDRRMPPEAKKVDGRKTLENISMKTGGTLYDATKKDNLEKAFSGLLEEIHNQFLLTYAPDRTAGDAVHDISITVKKKDYTAHVEGNYYSSQF